MYNNSGKKEILPYKKNPEHFDVQGFYFQMVRAERLELSRREALDPKSSVSTNSTTPALMGANI